MPGYFAARPRSEEEIAQEMMARQLLVEAVRNSPDWDRRRGVLNKGDWPPVTGEETKARFYANLGLLSPTERMKPSQFAEDTYNNLGTAANATLTGLMHAADGGGRVRDAAIRTAQEAHAGNPYGAVMNAAAAIPSFFLPEMAVGGQGMPDDWRESGRKLGVSERMLLGLDIGTDPLNYVTLGMARGLKHAAPLVRAAARIGGSAVEPAGGVIRQLVRRYPVPVGAAASGGGLMYYGLSGDE